MTERKGWRRVKFGDVVRLVTDRVTDPITEGIERYVGLDHIDPEDLRIRRWGLVTEGTTFTNCFKPGHVLFGKRRAYQRKVAVADFGGLCSGDIYVFESASKELMPELLPFICQSEAFYTTAIETSAGSLSPRTNWASLQAFEFNLPPYDEQESFVSLIENEWDNAVESLRDAVQECDSLTQSMIRELIGSRFGSSNAASNQWACVPLESVARVERGKFSHRPRNLPQFYGGPYPFVQTGDVAASRGLLESASQFLSEEGRGYSRSFPIGTILITIAAVIGATAITSSEIWCPDSVVGVVPNAGVMDCRFLEYVLRFLRPVLESTEATQTAQKNINLQVLRPLRVPLPALKEQKHVANAISEIDGRVRPMSERVRQLLRARSAVVEGFLKGGT